MGIRRVLPPLLGLPEDTSAWLEAKARQGWHLAKAGTILWTFEGGDPREDRYAVDWQSRWRWRQVAADTPAFPERTWQDEETEYLGLARAGGWIPVTHAPFGGLYVFRAEGPETAAFESDPAGLAEHVKQQMLHCLVLPTCWAPQAIFRLIQGLSQRPLWPPSGQLVFALVLLLFSAPLVWRGIRLYLRRRRLLKQLG